MAKILFLLVSVLTLRFVVIRLFHPSEDYLKVISHAYKEIQNRSIAKLPKDSPLLERCDKPDPYYKPCS